MLDNINYPLVIGIAVVVLIVLWLILTFNKLVNARELVRNSMGQIATQIESRWDALTSIIDATKQYSDHEARVLQDTTHARSSISRTSTVRDVEADTTLFQQAMGRIAAVGEAYPDLKANTVYTTAMSQIAEFENNVRGARMIFNDAVTRLNRIVLSFPSSLAAKLFSFKESDYFAATGTKTETPGW